MHCHYPREVVRIPEPTEERVVLFLDGSGVEGQPPMAGAAAVRVKGVEQVRESVVEKMVHGAASHGEVQAVADVVWKIGEEVREVWMGVDAEADMVKRYPETAAHGPEAVTPARTPSTPSVSGRSLSSGSRDPESEP